jgi:NAD(P)-dependent dehydrogenase (short-subunit alcohol dehydrogenase family)
MPEPHATTRAPQARADATSASTSLDGKVIVVTGGSRGLGAAISRVLGMAGARMVLADIELERARDHAAALGQLDIDAIALPLDVGNEQQVRNLMASVRERYGRLDVLVNNAGIDRTLPVAELESADWERVVRTNLTGPFLMVKHALTLMQRGGHIVNIASTASKRTWPNAAAYHATKWGLLGLSHALHAELRAQGIKVSAVVAGGMRTPFLLDRFPDVARTVRFVLSLPEDTVIPEVMVLPMRESSWP